MHFGISFTSEHPGNNDDESSRGCRNIIHGCDWLSGVHSRSNADLYGMCFQQAVYDVMSVVILMVCPASNNKDTKIDCCFTRLLYTETPSLPRNIQLTAPVCTR